MELMSQFCTLKISSSQKYHIGHSAVTIQGSKLLPVDNMQG